MEIACCNRVGGNMLTGRNTEYKFLQSYYEKNGCQILAVYGTKGIGKLSLLKEFIANKPVCFFTCRNCEDREQRFQFAKELGKTEPIDPFPSWIDLLHRSCDKKEVLVLEDFSNLLRPDSTFLTDLQSFYQTFDQKNKLLIILVSSSICWFENSMVKKMKRTALLIAGMIKIKQLDFYQIQDVFPAFPIKDQIILYGILGGNPKRWKLFDPTESVKNNIIRHFVQENAILQLEVQRILKDELRELNVYQTILSTLAMGNLKLNDIYIQTGFSRAKISVYLKNLIQLEIVEKIFSIEIGKQENVQKALYRISDPVVSFYYTFLFQNKSSLRNLNSREFYQKFIDPYLKGFITASYKKVCLEYLLFKAQRGELPIQIAQYGEWIGKKASIDIVLQDEQHRFLIAYCNWDKEKLIYEDYEWLLYSAKQAKIKVDYIWLFSASDFDDKLVNRAEKDSHIKLIGLSELKISE